MLKFTKTTKVYEYMELSDDAKENAKQWYLNDDPRSYELTDIFMEDIHEIFPNSKLEVQWSLNSCQGDGVNIYGSVDLHDIFSLPGSGRSPELDWIKGFLTEKEIRTMEFYMKEYKNSVDIPINRRYTYCMADHIDLAEDFQYELENMDIRDIKIQVLEKTERLIKQVFSQLCIQYEKIGYDHLYEIDDEEMAEICDSNNYYFYEDGSWFFEGDIEVPEELSKYWDNDGCLYRDIDREDDGTPREDIGRYEVIFDFAGTKYYCFIDAVSLEEAMFMFFKKHPHITYDMIEDHIEI